MKLERLIITCGGTGGHFYPGLSIARKFQETPGREVCLLLSGVNSVQQQKNAEKFGINAFVLPRMPSLKSAPFQFSCGLLSGINQAYKMIKKFNPQGVLAMGSFASAPVAVAAKLLKIPLFLHDGNVRIGEANRILSRLAKSMGLAYPPVNGNKLFCPWEVVGMPIREELVTKRQLTKFDAIKNLQERFAVNLNVDYPTLLIFGGSQGAEIFNKILPQALNNLAEKFKFQVLHLTGRGKLTTAQNNYTIGKFPLLLLETDEQMEFFFAATDLVCARSGGSTIAELTLFGKPAILIPYPFAKENHQAYNARYLVDNSAAVMIENEDFTVFTAQKILNDFFSGNPDWKKRAQQISTLAHPNAALAMIEYMEQNL